jgi:hypothetical protein
MNIPAFLSSMGLNDPVLQAAAIQGFFILGGILVTGLIAILAYLAIRRDDRNAWSDNNALVRFNLLHALRADARAQFRLLDALGNTTASRDHVIAGIEKGRWVQPPYIPFFLRDARTDLDTAIHSNVAALDHRLDDLAARYLTEKSFLSQYIDDLRTERFAQLPAEQKIDLVRSYFERLAAFRGACVALNARIETLLRIRRRDRDPAMQIK